ncbi:MAG: hypothetical protein GXO11_04970 [Epsilonproteobacteria bacterium]|nr:hypothetical protein [Campylobacterota bacterium]
MENISQENISNNVEKISLKKKKSPKKTQASTFFRNALRSNLDLTALADTKAGILISLNGFILTVSVTASSFIIHNELMTYAFISIILTSLGSIILAVLAVKPRIKEKLIYKEFKENYNSLLYYQDMATLSPDEYLKAVKEMLKSNKKTTKEMTIHLHILGNEIKTKYHWLKYAYTYFSLGLLLSASLIIYALLYTNNHTEFIHTNNKVYAKGSFYNIFEPSGATTLPDGKVLLVEDEQNNKSLKLIEFEEDGRVVEIGTPYMAKKIKKILKKNVDDLEAVTSVENTIFAITSFSPDRQNKEKKDRQRFLMMQYENEEIKSLLMYNNLLADLQRHFPNLFHQNKFFKSDLNIEAMTFDTNEHILYIGFRSPLYKNNAIIIGIKNPFKIFNEEEKPDFTSLIMVPLNHMGIRAMVFDKEKDGYWIIAGSSNERNISFELWFYSKKTATASKINEIADLGFAEGITIVQTQKYGTLLFIVDDDGKKPNKPATYTLLQKKGL